MAPTFVASAMCKPPNDWLGPFAPALDPCPLPLPAALCPSSVRRQVRHLLPRSATIPIGPLLTHNASRALPAAAAELLRRCLAVAAARRPAAAELPGLLEALLQVRVRLRVRACVKEHKENIAQRQCMCVHACACVWVMGAGEAGCDHVWVGCGLLPCCLGCCRCLSVTFAGVPPVNVSQLTLLNRPLARPTVPPLPCLFLDNLGRIRWSLCYNPENSAPHLRCCHQPKSTGSGWACVGAGAFVCGPKGCVKPITIIYLARIAVCRSYLSRTRQDAILSCADCPTMTQGPPAPGSSMDVSDLAEVINCEFE